MASFIEFPIFTGVSGDLRPWISWLEAFFVREKFKKLEKMNLAQSLLEGEAESWFYSIQKTLIFYDWRELKDKLLLRFGDVADSDRIRLNADLDRFLLKQRADAKLRRLSRTAITPQESISSPATIHETVPVAKFPNQHVDEISGEKKDESHEATMVTVLDSLEEESITQNQVPVSKLEHSLPIPKKSLNVCENSQAVVSCEHQRSIQKTIGLDVVNSDVERIQCVMRISKNVSAHQVLDKMCQLKSLKPKNKRKLSLSLKTWMFKFKNKLLHRNKSTNRILAELNFDAVNVSTSRSNKSSDPSSFVIRVRDYSKYGTVIKTDLGKEEKVHELPHQEKILKDGDDDDEKILSQYRPSMLVEDALLEVVTKPVAECKTTNTISFTHHKSQERFAILIKQRDDEASTNIIDNAARSSGSRAKSLLIEMGFCPTFVQQAIDENGEALELLLAILTKITVAEEPSFHGLVEPNPELDIESETDSRRVTLLTLKFPENLVDWLMDFTGYDGIVDDIRCLAIGVCSGIKQPIDSRQASRVWERGGLDISAGLMDWLMKCFTEMLMQVNSSTGDFKLWRWLVFDRGKNHIISGEVITLVFLDNVEAGFLLRLVSISSYVGASLTTKNELIRKAGLQREKATLEDLLLPPHSSSHRHRYDTDLVATVLGSFLMLWRRQSSVHHFSNNSQLLHSIRTVAKLIDSYLQAVALAVHMSFSKFVSLAEAVPDIARAGHDRLYKAINIYLKVHPEISKEEKKIASLLEVVCVLAECMMHNSFALWHRWRRKASICALPLHFSFFKLEDKLVFREGSIDTFHQAFGDVAASEVQIKTRDEKKALPLKTRNAINKGAELICGFLCEFMC